MDTNSQIAELLVEVRHLREDIAELKQESKENRDHLAELSHEIATLKEQQNQDKQEFSDRKQVEKELKISLEKVREQSQQEIKDLKSELELIRSLGQSISKTPGGLKTWAIAGIILLLLSLTVIDTGVRAIGVDRLVRHLLIQQINIESVMSD